MLVLELACSPFTATTLNGDDCNFFVILPAMARRLRNGVRPGGRLVPYLVLVPVLRTLKLLRREHKHEREHEPNAQVPMLAFSAASSAAALPWVSYDCSYV